MCGVFGVVGQSKAQGAAAETVLTGLKLLEYRGYDSWGVAVADSSQSVVTIKKQVGKIGEATVADLPHTSCAVGHTRWATHGGVTQQNAHPHLDCTGKIAVVHNGIVTNYLLLKQQLIAAGHVFVSETDSEVVAHLIEEKLKVVETMTEAVRQSFLCLEGQNALVVLSSKHEELIVVRKGSPLVIGLGTDCNWVASDPTALVAHTNKVVFLADGEMAIVRSDGMSVMEVASRQMRKITPDTLQIKEASVTKAGFNHYLLKEISEQPAVIQQIVERSATDLRHVADAMQHQLAPTHTASISSPISTRSVYGVACGSAAFAARLGAQWLRQLAGIRLQVVTGSEFADFLPLIHSGDVVMGISQSGETMDVLEPIREAHAAGASIGAITNVVGSSLWRVADWHYDLGAGPELAVATTKAFMAKATSFLLLAAFMSRKKTTVVRVKNDVLLAQKAIQRLLSPTQQSRYQSLAESLLTTEHAYIIGKGVMSELAHEMALKLKETAYLHAEGMAAGELKHGTLALISPGTPCFVCVLDDDQLEKTISAAMEIAARGGRVIVVGPKQLISRIPEGMEFVSVPDAGLATPLVELVVMQLLAYYLAVRRGIDPDKPRNLAKSVTVG